MNRLAMPSKALRDTSLRILKKLTVVLLAVVAFFSLRALENAKTEYEKERAQPIVIVDVDPASRDANREFVIKLDSETVQKRLETIIEPSLKDSDRSAAVIALETLSNSIKTSIRDARRTPFPNQEKFVEYLGGRIDAGKVAADKYLSDTKAQRSKRFDELGAKHSKGAIGTLEEELADGADKKFEVKFEIAKETKRKSLVAGDEISPQDLVALAKKADEERDLEDQKLVSDAAYKNIDRLHSKFVPDFLTPYVKSRKDPSPLSSSLSEMVFDERRGGHVIYQVFYLSFVCVLVFGVLFPIYLLLRIFPAFSSGVEPLREQAKGLLTRRGAAAVAAPALMKTVALSAAAVGIGAAVVIANNPVTSPKPPENVAVVSEPETSGHPPVRPPTGPIKTTPPPGPSPEVSPETTPSPTIPPVVTPEPPINLYPRFYPTFRMDNTRVAQLEREYRSTKNLVELLETNKLGKQEFKDQTAGFVTNEQLTTRVADLPVIRSDVSNLKLGVTDLTSREIPTLRADLEKTSTDLSTRLDNNIRAIVGFREGTQGRSIGSRTRELLGREHYEARPESNQILRQLMCRAPCEKEERILSRLDALVGQGKMGKDTFLGRLGIRPSRSVPRSDWELLILRYSRVPY